MPSIDWQRVAEAELHPMRTKVLKAIDASREPRSPNELSKEFGEPLGNVSYHVAALAKKGLIELVKTEPRRGALEHFYGIAPGVSR